jgi:hypothetical protein
MTEAAHTLDLPSRQQPGAPERILNASHAASWCVIRPNLANPLGV